MNAISINFIDLGYTFLEKLAIPSELSSSNGGVGVAGEADDINPMFLAYANTASSSSSATVDSRCPLRKEFDDYMKLIHLDWGNKNTVGKGPNYVRGLDSLKVWPTLLKVKFPILARFAAIILALHQACSAEAERLFSSTGRIKTVQRSAMSAESLKKLTLVCAWKKDKECLESNSQAKRRLVASRFASLVIKDNMLVPETPLFVNDIDDSEQQAVRLFFYIFPHI